MYSKRTNAAEGVGKIAGGIFGILFKRNWFRWFLKISLALIILDIVGVLIWNFFVKNV